MKKGWKYFVPMSLQRKSLNNKHGPVLGEYISLEKIVTLNYYCVRLYCRTFWLTRLKFSYLLQSLITNIV